MAAITNWAIALYQEKNIQTQEDLNKFNKTAETLKYTPYVDLALSMICTIGAMLALKTAVLASTLLVFGTIFFISGAGLLRTNDSLNGWAKAVNNHWNAHMAYFKLKL